MEKAENENIYVIIDEIQNCFPKESNDLRYGKWIEKPNVIRFDSSSKRYGLAEYRTGWIIADNLILGDRMHGIVGRMSGLMGNAPRAANTALTYIMDKEIEKLTTEIDFLEKINSNLLEKKNYVQERLVSIPGVNEIISPDACINLTIRTNFKGTDMELAGKLMKNGTLIMPTSGYGYNASDSTLRFTFAEKYKRLEHALDTLEKTLR